MKTIKLIIIIIISNISCNTIHKQPSDLQSEDTILFQAKLLDSTSSIPYYQSDAFSAIDIEATIFDIKNKFGDFLKCTKEPSVNKYDSIITDTILAYHYANSIIKIYKTGQSHLLLLYDISDSIFSLNGKIKTGLSKEEFAYKFAINDLTPDTFYIGNTEQTFVFKFYFRNNILTRISSSPYFD